MVSVSIKTKGRKVISPFKNNFLKQESSKFVFFCIPAFCLHQLFKISQIISMEVSMKVLVLCELIKFLGFQGLGKHSVWNCGVSYPEYGFLEG